MILAGLAGLAWLGLRWLQRGSSRHPGGLPNAAVELIGTRPITPTTAVHLVRVGSRLLVLGGGADGLRTLSEISDPEEVARVEQLCQAPDPIAGHIWGRGWQRRPSPATRRSNTSAVDTEQSPKPPAAVDTPDAHPTAARLTATGRHLGAACILLLCQTVGWSQSPESIRSSLQPRPFAQEVSSPAPRATQLPPWTEPSSPSPLLPNRSGPIPAQSAPAPTAGDWPVPNRQAVQRVAAVEPPAGPIDMTVGPEPLAATTSPTAANAAAFDMASWLSPSGLSSTLRFGLLIGVMSLAPAILLMTTCYVRVILVLSLLRQALGVPQFPPTQVLTSLSLFITALVMWPVWQRSYHEGIAPYLSQSYSSDAEQLAAGQQALTGAVAPAREFMSRQIEATGNSAAVDLFLDYQAHASATSPEAPQYYEDVPLPVLLPAFVLSELKTAFLIGCQIYLPFVVLDLIVASVLTGLGLVSLPPAAIALPLKVLLFVLMDGWRLTVEVLLTGLAPIS